jgi:Protein of unknown function (DUF3558)
MTLLAALFTLAALAGCSDKSGGNARPETTSASTNTTDSSGTPSAPELSLAKFLANPCDVLPPAQIAPFGKFREPTSRKAPLGPSCRWPGQDVTVDSTIAVSFGDGQEYDSLLNNSRKSAVFNELTVEGRRAFSSDDTDGTVGCTTIVETGAKSSIAVQTNVNDKKPCELAEKVAAVVIKTLKG